MLSISQLLHPSQPQVLVAAHLGAWRWAPENSLAAIDEAVSLGADIVELDVRATRDGVLVLMHDATIDRMTDGSGAIAACSYGELRQRRLRASDGGTTPLTGQRVPTLAAALEAARGRIAVNIDTKDEQLLDPVAAFVVAAGLQDQLFVKATIAQADDIERVRLSPFFGHVPFVPMMRACNDAFTHDLQAMAELHCPMVEAGFDSLAALEAGLGELQRQQARLWVNTIDCSHSLNFNDSTAATAPDAVWGRLLQAGVGAIQTDDVGPLLAYLRACGRHA
jgi:glycerophosphoryl diester phosphodiesterase